jgi:hypothetical protein
MDGMEYKIYIFSFAPKTKMQYTFFFIDAKRIIEIPLNNQVFEDFIS